MRSIFATPRGSKWIARRRFTLDQRQFSQVVAIEIEQVEGNHHDARRLALHFVLQDRKIRGAVGGRNDDFAVDDRGSGANVPGVVGEGTTIKLYMPRAHVSESQPIHSSGHIDGRRVRLEKRIFRTQPLMARRADQS